MMTVLAQPPQVDLHLDTPTQLLTKQLDWDAPEGLEAGLAQLRAGGTNLPVMVLWPPRQGDHVARTFALMEVIEKQVDRIAGVHLVRDPTTARSVVANGGIGVIISLEGAHGLGTGDWLANLDNLHGRGLALLGLTWSMSNRFAGSSGDKGEGLTEEGLELVREANRRGLVLDVSHASRQATMEVCRMSVAPVIASHSNSFRLKGATRNLTDDEIRCIGEKGGVIGLNFHSPFVGTNADVGMVADHADAIAAIAGHGAVALGSDFDGFIRTPSGLSDAGTIGALWEELARRGWSEEQILGVRGENFLRTWASVLASRTTP